MTALYGRTELLVRARASVKRALTGEGRVLLFTGEPGIGKSCSVEALAHEASLHGAAVAWGRCWEAGGAPAYWPWMQVFRSLALDDDPFAGATLDLAHGSEEARFAAFDGVARSLRAVAQRRPLALVLDDLHAADTSSLLLLLFLSRELARVPLLLLGAYRDAEVAQELAPLLAKLAREAEVVPLARLRPDDVAAWLRDVSPEATPARADELYRLTEGQPLFVVEALRLGHDGEARVAWSLGPRAVLDERLGRLSATTRALLETAAVLGREFSQDALAALCDAALDAVHAALLEALHTSIVVPAMQPGTFRFTHVLLRDRLYAELLPSTRAALHVRAGIAAADSGGDVQAAAHHLFEGRGAVPAARVAEVALAAAQAALHRLAFEDAAQLARRALGLGAELAAAVSGRLEVIAAEALIRLGDHPAGKALAVQAAARAERTADAELRAVAALAYATELATGTLDPQMIALLRGALAALAACDSALRARVTARLCAALTPPPDASHAPEIMTLMRESIDMARRLNDPHTLLYVLQFAATVGLLVSEHERSALLEETMRLARGLRQPLVLLRALPAYLTQEIAVGRLREACAHLPEYTALVAESRQPAHQVRYLAVRSLIEALQGDLTAAAAWSERAREWAYGDAALGPLFTWLSHRVAMAALLGDPDWLLREGSAFSASHGAAPSTSYYIAWFLAASGQREQARARLRAVDLNAAKRGLPVLWELHAAAETCVLLGDAEFGAELYPHAVRAADRSFWALGPGAIVGPSARPLADLARLLGRIPDALRHYDAAIAAYEQLGAPWLAERCRALRARVREDQGAPPAPPASAAEPVLTLQRDADIWTIRTRTGDTLRVKHGKGLSYLQHLIARPGSEVHVLELAGIEHRTGDAGPVLDAKAKAAYRTRLSALREELADAERVSDPLRASRAQAELDALAEQLASAVGLGGRDRRAASDVERTRINVQRRLKDAIDRIAALDPALGKYLAAAVKTGTSCVFEPL